MNGDESLARAINEPVRLVEYDPDWPASFRAERDRLLALFPDRLLGVAHFGSTAVPGMPAKPIIDLLAGVTSMQSADELIEPLLEARYTTSHEFNATLTGRRWLMRWANGRRTHHLHLVVFQGMEWRRRLAFRDALRSDPSLARQYADLKKHLAAEYRTDREAYTRAKGEFIESVIGER